MCYLTGTFPQVTYLHSLVTVNRFTRTVTHTHLHILTHMNIASIDERIQNSTRHSIDVCVWNTAWLTCAGARCVCMRCYAHTCVSAILIPCICTDTILCRYMHTFGQRRSLARRTDSSSEAPAGATGSCCCLLPYALCCDACHQPQHRMLKCLTPTWISIEPFAADSTCPTHATHT